MIIQVDWVRRILLPAVVTLARISLFHHADHSVEGLYLDNVVVSTERIGCP